MKFIECKDLLPRPLQYVVVQYRSYPNSRWCYKFTQYTPHGKHGKILKYPFHVSGEIKAWFPLPEIEWYDPYIKKFMKIDPQDQDLTQVE
jgi:hypothetical protein